MRSRYVVLFDLTTRSDRPSVVHVNRTTSEELQAMYDDGIEDIEFPTAICSITDPHEKHLIPGTWRQQCPGVVAAILAMEGVERSVCRHDHRPIARRTDRGPQAKWFHNDDRGGRGCADGISEAEPLIIDADSFCTPVGAADGYNELGEPSGYAHRSAG
jgi:hypothetical protein